MPRERVSIAVLFLPPNLAATVPSTCSVRSCAGKAMQAPHSRYLTSHVLLGCSPPCRGTWQVAGGNLRLRTVAQQAWQRQVPQHRDTLSICGSSSSVDHGESPLVVPVATAVASTPACVLELSHGQHVTHRKTPLCSQRAVPPQMAHGGGCTSAGGSARTHCASGQPVGVSASRA